MKIAKIEKTTEYLYGKGFSKKILNMQKKIARYKIERAKELKYELIEDHYTVRDDERLNAINEAEKFNEKLLTGY